MVVVGCFFNRITGNMFCYTHSYSQFHFFNRSYLKSYMKRQKTSRIKPGFHGFLSGILRAGPPLTFFSLSDSFPPPHTTRWGQWKLAAHCPANCLLPLKTPTTLSIIKMPFTRSTNLSLFSTSGSSSPTKANLKKTHNHSFEIFIFSSILYEMVQCIQGLAGDRPTQDIQLL